MRVKKISEDTFEITETFLGFATSRYEIFIDYGKEYVTFSNYSPVYLKKNGKKLGVFSGIRIQDEIEAFKRVNKWKD